MGFQHILFEARDGVARLTLNRPDALNSLTDAMHIELRAALDQVQADPAIRVLVLSGAGRGFCAGQDLADPGMQAVDGKLPDLGDIVERNYKPLVLRLQNLRVPTVAAVNGVAAGAGASLALACDLIVAARNAVFVMAYSSVALSPDGGGSWSLAQALPRQLVNELLMSGERIGAQRLHELGVVNRLCDAGQALGTALEWSEKLAARAPNVMSSIKELVSEARHHSFTEQLALERSHFVRNLQHAPAGETRAASADPRA